LKTLKRVLFYLALTFGVLTIALVASVFFFKDRIINQFIREANKQLSTPVKIGKIEVSIFQQFPQLSIILNDVYVEDSHPGIYPLLTARQISFQLNPILVYSGDYTIHGLTILDSETNLKINDKGETNYRIVNATTSDTPGTMTFELSNVKLINTKVNYSDKNMRQFFTFTSTDLDASIHSTNDIYNIEANGQLTTDKMEVNSHSVLAGKSFQVDSRLVYDDVNKSLQIDSSTVTLRHSTFKVSGSYKWKDRNAIDITTRAARTDIQSIISILPEHIVRKLEKYESDGDAYFSARLKGELSERKKPSISSSFGLRNARIYHPDYKSQLENVSVEGSFASSDVTSTRDATLILKNITGKLNREKFTANFVISNFDRPQVICDFHGKLDAPSVLSFYPIDEIKDIKGSLLADVSFEGVIELLKDKRTAQGIATQGTVELQNIDLKYGTAQVPLHNLTGNLQFNNNDLALSNVSGKLGNSDFVLNGFFKNIITFLVFENQPIGIETDLKSNYIDLDQLFTYSFGTDSDNPNQEYTFRISPNVSLNFNCDVRSLKYKRFRGSSLQGDLLVKNEMAVSRNFAIKTMGGDLKLAGIVDAKNQKAIDVVVTSTLNKIHLDSIFYVFENFNQDFIKDEHLKGEATADVSLEMTLNQHLRLFPETLIADIGVTVKNGQLNNFEPLQKLRKYLDDEGLSRLRFADLKNDIHIENKTVYIPQMLIRSNVTDLTLSGTHAFDQHIDYRVVAPLRKKKLDPEAALAMEDDLQGGAKLFLKIVGTTDDYNVAYDTEAVRKKIASDFKKEVQELKEAFKTKGKKKQKEVELQKDDYFDWDQNQ
jgi:hypothetical protein